MAKTQVIDIRSAKLMAKINNDETLEQNLSSKVALTEEVVSHSGRCRVLPST